MEIEIESGEVRGSAEVENISLDEIAKAFGRLLNERKEWKVGTVTCLRYRGRGAGRGRPFHWILTKNLIQRVNKLRESEARAEG